MGLELDTHDEADLLARSRGGDLGAFNVLVERYQRGVYNLCLRMLGSPEAAEDAAQEAFIAAFRAIRSFRGGRFRPWLFRIASNACYDEMRRRRARPAVSLNISGDGGDRAFDVPDRALALDQHVENMETGRILQDALLRLHPDQRLAIVLADVYGFDYSEIADITRTSLGTVKSRISRGRSHLRDILLEQRELLPSRFRQTSEET